MGKAISTVSRVFTKEEMDEYEDLTFLTRAEILEVYRKFSLLCFEDEIDKKRALVPVARVMNIPELQANPFKDRICKVFSSNEDAMSFEDLLDLFSAFSEKAPKSMKIFYAFRIYDFDEDNIVSSKDIKEVLSRVTGDNKLTATETKKLIQNVMVEGDLDEDGYLSFPEFEHLMLKSPDFFSTFKIRL